MTMTMVLILLLLFVKQSCMYLWLVNTARLHAIMYRICVWFNKK